MLGVSEADVGGKVKIEGKDPVIEKIKDDPAMKAQTADPFVDTNVILDRNAGIGSLLWDLPNSQDPDCGGPPLLDPAFTFIDVGASRWRPLMHRAGRDIHQQFQIEMVAPLR